MAKPDLHGACGPREAHEIREGLGPAVVVSVAIGVLHPARIHAAAPEGMSLAAVDRVDVPRRRLEGGILVRVAPLVRGAGSRLQAVAIDPDRVAGLAHLPASMDPGILGGGPRRCDLAPSPGQGGAIGSRVI